MSYAQQIHISSKVCFVQAYAKINLTLDVLGRRTDGYHELATVMQTIDLHDTICLTATDDNRVHMICTMPELSNDENLAARAAYLVRERLACTQGVRIELYKRIPTTAGLGGGSSDAAAVLLALEQWWQLQLSPSDLLNMAASLGSDVPFFIFQAPALCKGRGELVTAVKLKGKLSLLLLKPAFVVSTAWGYSRWQQSREIWHVSYTGLELAGQIFVNDLERPVFEKFVFLAQLKMWLLEQAEVGAALMSGSGSTVFALLRENADAKVIAKRAKTELDPELWTFATQTL